MGGPIRPCMPLLGFLILLRLIGVPGRELLQANYPTPTIYFSLQDESLASNSPANAYHGTGHNVSWVQDATFGSVLQCNQTEQSYVEIPGVAYGQDGEWAIAVWVKWDIGAGDALEYILSQNNSDNSNAALSPDTVAIYVPEQGNPSYGVVRALVNDGSDRQGNSSAPLYLDSSGCVSELDCPTGNNASLIESNTTWHLVGITTLPGGGEGYQMYIDGILSGQMTSSMAPFIDYMGGTHEDPHGGDAMNLTGDLILCARSDLDIERFFTGQLVDLMIWNRSLTADEWAVLANTSSLVSVKSAAEESSFPEATIYFPLQNDSLTSAEPAGLFQGTPHDITWISDPVFGSVVHCDRAANSSIAIPGVTYGQNGSWAMALWVKWDVGDGEGLEFVLSQNNSDNSNAALSPDTVAVYLPQQDNPNFGVVRAIVHDSTDRQGNSSIPLYLDSNGCVSEINCTNPNNSPALFVADPEWHLIGLTTFPNNSKGYEMYIDGAFAAAITTIEYMDYMGGLHSVNGGDAMNMTGDLTLCARSDLDSDRFFTGDITQLRLWNTSLSAADWEALYNQTAAPSGGSSGESEYPPALAYFSLQNGNLASSLPYRAYEGVGTNITFVDDEGFGSAVLQCNQSVNSSVAIPGLEYGQNGSWALALWVKWEVMPGASVEYILSQNNSDNANPTMSPDTVALYLPEMDNPSYGVVRALVHDSDDRQGNSTVPLYLDSNGCVSDINCLNEKNMTLFTGTSQWHLVGLTTHPNNSSKGFQMYIDGALSAELEAIPYTDYLGGLHSVNGGDAMNLTGDMVLCARSDLDPDRFFTGRLAQLMIWNQSLTASDFEALYSSGSAYIRSTPSPELQPAPPSPTPSPPAPTQTTAAVALIAGQPICTTNGTVPGLNSLSSCYEGYVCAPLTEEQVAEELPQFDDVPEGTIGVCAYAPYGYLLPSPSIVPVPMAFYPLGSQTLQSFPLPTYSGVNSGATVVSDPVFGAAVSCLGNESDLIGLSTPNFTESGPFTLNLWMSVANLSGDSMAYLYSQVGRQSNQSNTGWDANQIEIYVPEEGHQAYGVVRAYARDGNDSYQGIQSQTWLDSDGNVSNNQRRTSVSPALDGSWHMITLTTIPEGGKGFRLYVDGSLVNEIKGNQTFMSDSGVVVGPSAGLPMDLNPTAVLCTRADGPSERQYDGRLAYLGLYDEALSEEQVAELFNAVEPALARQGTTNGTPSSETQIFSTPAEGATTNSSQVTTSGNVCVFPALYQGNVITACVRINDGLYCPVSNGNWEQCVDNATEAGSVPAVETISRTTVSGERCIFPATFQGQVVTDCVDYGGSSICLTNSGYWETCRDESPSSSSAVTTISPVTASVNGDRVVRSASGEQCSLPLTYQGMDVDNCVSISGSYWCWDVGSAGWMACANGTFATGSGEVGAADPGSVPVPVVPRMDRWTEEGQLCMLPYVVDGVLIDDCIVHNGNLSCITSSGSWANCANPSSENPNNNALLVANRTSVSGEPCLLPAVINGYLFFDCAQYTTTDATGGDTTATTTTSICPISNGTWVTCSGTVSADPFVFDPELTFAREAQGRRGQLCSLDPSSGSSVEACASGQTCLPFPDFNATGLEDVGFCQTTPVGGLFDLESQVFYSSDDDGIVGLPLAFFPLTGGNLDSYTLPLYNGTVEGASPLLWLNDTVFGQVPRCQKNYLNSIDLADVPLGRTNGSFAINMWMRRPPGSNTTGDGYQYLLSQGAHRTAAAATANSISIYVADDNNTAAGLVRVMVLDGNDNGGSEANYIDSDGQVNNLNGRNSSAISVNDGNWHMISVTTHTNGSLGYSLYLDGRLVASLWDGMLDSQGNAVNVSAGQPITSSDVITLCARYDKITDRYYDGEITHLMLWEEPLGDGQVAQLYDAYVSAAPASGDTAITAAGQESQFAPASSSSGGSGLSGGAIAGIVIGSLAAVGIIALAVGFVVRRRAGGSQRFERYKEEGPAPPMGPDLPRYLPGTGGKHMEAEMSSQASSIKDSGRGSPPNYGEATGVANPFTPSPARPSVSSFTTQASDASTVDIQTGRRGFGSFRRGPATVMLRPESEAPQDV